MAPYTVKTEYVEQMVPEYQGNPLIEALPDIRGTDQVVRMLSDKAAYNSGERELDAQYRLHCIHRLFRYFQPLEQHIYIEQRISRSIRQGYLDRNPLTPEYAAGMADGFAAMKEKPFAFTQLVWLKLDCPHDGSQKQLCYQFFTKWTWQWEQTTSSSIQRGGIPWICC